MLKETKRRQRDKMDTMGTKQDKRRHSWSQSADDNEFKALKSFKTAHVLKCKVKNGKYLNERAKGFHPQTAEIKITQSQNKEKKE